MNMPPLRTVRLTRDGATVTVMIDREPKLNALAAEIGLVNHVVPADHLLADAIGLAEHIIGHSATACATAGMDLCRCGCKLPGRARDRPRLTGSPGDVGPRPGELLSACLRSPH